MAQSNRWYPRFSAAQDLQSAIKGAFDRIYANQDSIDSTRSDVVALQALGGASGRVVLAKLTVSGTEGELVFVDGRVTMFTAPT